MKESVADINAKSGTFKVGALQFPVTGDVAANAAHIERLMRDAKRQNVSVAVTPEGALSGYAFADFSSWDEVSFAAIRRETQRLMAVAAELEMMLILGSAHFVDDETLPMNALYVISKAGVVVDRYDKSMLTEPDQLQYTAGTHPVVVDVEGTRVGLLVCYDICYPEMYARYRDLGVTVMLHAFYNAGFDAPNILDEIKPAWIRARAADNQMHVVAVNSSRAHSSWGSMTARPDGSIAHALDAHDTAVLVQAFPDDERKGWPHNFKPMKLAKDEVFHRGKTAASHPRISNRRAIP